MTGVALARALPGTKARGHDLDRRRRSSTGAFHEGLNFAAVQRAPLVLVIENNQWAYSTPVDAADCASRFGGPRTRLRHHEHDRGWQRRGGGVSHGERGRQAGAEGGGPVLIEAKTMRMRGHAQHDPAEYVPKKMFEYWKARDPIARYERTLTARGILPPSVKRALDARIQRVLADDVAFAEASPMPSAEDAAAGAPIARVATKSRRIGSARKTNCCRRNRMLMRAGMWTYCGIGRQ